MLMEVIELHDQRELLEHKEYKVFNEYNEILVLNETLEHKEHKVSKESNDCHERLQDLLLHTFLIEKVQNFTIVISLQQLLELNFLEIFWSCIISISDLMIIICIHFILM